jgi:hypothetical protein
VTGRDASHRIAARTRTVRVRRARPHDGRMMQYRPKFLKRCFQRLRRTFFCSVTRNSSWDSGSSRIFSTSLPRRSSERQDLAVRSRPAHPVQAAGCAAARVGAGDLQRRVPG